jgi:hypothetical protein
MPNNIRVIRFIPDRLSLLIADPDGGHRAEAL